MDWFIYSALLLVWRSLDTLFHSDWIYVISFSLCVGEFTQFTQRFWCVDDIEEEAAANDTDTHSHADRTKNSIGVVSDGKSINKRCVVLSRALSIVCFCVSVYINCTWTARIA